MASALTPEPFDPAKEARRLAAMFNGFSNSVDDFRIGLPEDTPPIQMARLKAQAQALEDQSHEFTAEAIGATLEAIQKDLAHIKLVTSDAKDQLEVLKDVSKVIAIVGSAVDLGAAIAAGSPGDILAATEALAQEVAG